MAMMPKRVKHRKSQRGRIKGNATRGNRVVFGNLDGHFYVHDRAGGGLAWAFAAGEIEDPRGRRRKAQVGAFLFAGGRLFITTTRALVAIGEDPEAEPVAPGFVLGR